MDKHLKKSFFLILYITALAVLFPLAVAAEEAADLSGIGYSYKIIKPENQKGFTGYFDLRMTPSQQQTVEIELYNQTDKEITVNLSMHGAKTNSNGVIEYGPSKIENDASLKYDIVDIVKVPESVTIPPKGTEKALVEITMPEEQYDGYISGGIYMQKAPTEEEKKAEKEATGVVNKYVFIVGLLLSETDTVVEPELSFNSIGPGLTNYRNAFIVDFSNITATYVEEMTVDAQIFKKGSDEILYDTKKENFRMAPNTKIHFPVNLNGERFETGDYTGKIKVTSKGKTWEWTEDFTVTQKDADKYNEQDVSLIQDRGINWKLIVMIAAGAIVMLVVIYMVVRTLSKKKKSKKRKRKKSVKKRLN